MNENKSKGFKCRRGVSGGSLNVALNKKKKICFNSIPRWMAPESVMTQHGRGFKFCCSHVDFLILLK